MMAEMFISRLQNRLQKQVGDITVAAMLIIHSLYCTCMQSDFYLQLEESPPTGY